MVRLIQQASDNTTQQLPLQLRDGEPGAAWSAPLLPAPCRKLAVTLGPSYGATYF